MRRLAGDRNPSFLGEGFWSPSRLEGLVGVTAGAILCDLAAQLLEGERGLGSVEFSEGSQAVVSIGRPWVLMQCVSRLVGDGFAAL
jgi:hypothetical protein